MDLHAIIIEDEQAGLDNLKNILLSCCSHVKVIAEARNIEEGYLVLTDKSLQPDVVFMDINLNNELVFNLLDRLDSINFEIIFVTAYQQHAVRACAYSSIGFISKPIDPSLLKEAIERVRIGEDEDMKDRLEVFRGHINHMNPFKKITIASLDEMHFIHIHEIVRLQSDDNYTIFHTKNGGKIIASKTIKSYENMFIPFNFFRVHRSHIVNLNYIQKFIKGDSAHLIMMDGTKIDVSRRRKGPFSEKLKELQKELA
ncbi:MAG TPA: response regulator transcription factor [Phaeodactylibacter sp.]|nr:response regulator transcription factor [Phaeodactylibacter sp.]